MHVCVDLKRGGGMRGSFSKEMPEKSDMELEMPCSKNTRQKLD